MAAFTILGQAGVLEVGYGPGKVWVAGAFLSPEDADRLVELTAKAAAEARGEVEHPATPGRFL